MVQPKVDAKNLNVSQGFFAGYAHQLSQILIKEDWQAVETLGHWLIDAITSENHLYICGNGGSAANAMHIANDFIYGVSPKNSKAVKAEALSANTAVLTCLGNDLGYENIFARQLKVKATKDDILLVLSGSGNSTNIVAAIEQAQKIGMKTTGVLGYNGGKAKLMLDLPIHFAIDDMQLAEDLQLIVGHMLMRFLCDERSS